MVAHLLKGLDASQPAPGSEASSQRMISRSIKQWQADQLLRSSRARIEPPARSRWIWFGPVAAAAVLLISWGVWWGIQPDKYSPISNAATEATPNALAVDATDDITPDGVAAGPTDSDFSFDDPKADAVINTNIAYVQGLAELTQLPTQ
jgi:hypothetical protein